MVVEFAKLVGTVGAKGDVAPTPVLPNADVNGGADAKADWIVVEAPLNALGAAVVPTADRGIVEDPLITLDAGDAELKALCEGAVEPKALCTGVAEAKALCAGAGAPNALCVGAAVGVPNDDCPNTDPCVGADVNADV